MLDFHGKPNSTNGIEQPTIAQETATHRQISSLGDSRHRLLPGDWHIWRDIQPEWRRAQVQSPAFSTTQSCESSVSPFFVFQVAAVVLLIRELANTAAAATCGIVLVIPYCRLLILPLLIVLYIWATWRLKSYVIKIGLLGADPRKVGSIDR